MLSTHWKLESLIWFILRKRQVFLGLLFLDLEIEDFFKCPFWCLCSPGLKVREEVGAWEVLERLELTLWSPVLNQNSS